MSRKKTIRMILILGSLGVGGVIFAGQTLNAGMPVSPYPRAIQQRNDEQFRSAFRSAAASARQSVVTIICNAREVAYGCVVEPDGHILTKASELSGVVKCRLSGGKEHEAKVVGINESFDLALLKIDAQNLKPIEWTDEKDIQIGQLISIPGPAPVPVAAGVVSVGRRTATARTGILGVQLEDAAAGPRVAVVVSNSGADRAGIKVNDIILSVAGIRTRSREELTREVQRHPVGSTLQVTVLRNDKEIETKATVGNRPPTTQQAIIDTLNGPVSNRRDGFPDVFQHDAIIEPAECGSPVVDVAGKAIGINIARSGRTESLAIHAVVLKRIIGELKKPH